MFKTYSRFRWSFEQQDEDGVLFVTDDEPLLYMDLPNNTFYEVREGDTWQSIAAEKLNLTGRENAQCYTIIMDYQPEPYLDATVMPPPGTKLVIPHSTTVENYLRSPSRRRLS